MRKIAVVGAGIAGLLTAHGLRRAGFDVSLYSDRTAETWLSRSRPTGSACRFEAALAYERELGLDGWHSDAPGIVGATMGYCPTPGVRLASLMGRHERPALAIDVRLQSHAWLNELEARGGRVFIEHVTVARLDAIAAEHDLTIVAAGKAELASLFPRDPRRSAYSKPMRTVAMVIVTGPAPTIDGMPFTGVKTNKLEGVGEAVWIPYFHRDAGPSWSLIFEACVGGPMDIFGGARSGEDALACARRVIAESAPWDAPWARSMKLADPLGWLVGSVTPTVRAPVATLASGRVVTCVGDTAVHFDPLAAQGANNGTRMARHIVKAVVDRGDRPFDAAWMCDTFNRFWEADGRHAYELTNLFLEPMTSAGRLLLLAQFGSDGVRLDGRQRIADFIANGFAEPVALVPALTDPTLARRIIEQATGRSWLGAAARGALEIAGGQLRERIAALRA
ncbi:MAG: NAD(P)-binding protein [Polyangiaceae bacterium]|nr:NAD(P)-binding protein [Polyangiaceae bacterium]